MDTRHDISLFAVLGLLLLMLAAMPAAGNSASDIRILIDISGSMKLNDPQKLRAPALRLITGLLPDGSRAGVWTYGQYVNMLVPHGRVDAAWKARAQSASQQINSAGLYTNIEEALSRASRDWHTADPASQRHVILLTDGWVDISKEAAQNAASRNRIVNEILPRLRDAKVKIHAVALSKEADHVLLRQLAAATDGWYEQVDAAETLQRVFLRMFEKAAKPDTLPLKDNAVRVDASIEEMTFLVFREADKNVELITPGKATLTAAHAPASVRWHHDAGYDLITVTKPEAGSWHIAGTQDRDNRVMVVTNLKVRATSLPNNIYVDDAPYYFVQLTQQGTVIRQKDFLDLVNITLTMGDAQGRRDARLLDDGQAPDVSTGDGTFSYRLGAPLKEGRYELNLLVDGTTFQREQRQEINVYSQPAVATVAADPADGGRYVLAVVPHAGLIDAQTLQATALITKPDGQTTEVALAQQGPAEWRQEIRVNNAEGNYTAEFTVQGMRPDGKPISKKLDRISFGAGGVKLVAEAAPTAPEAAPAVEAPAEAAAPAPEAQPPAEEDEQHINWFTVAWQALLINALLAPLAYFGFRKWRRSHPPVISASLEEASS